MNCPNCGKKLLEYYIGEFVQKDGSALPDDWDGKNPKYNKDGWTYVCEANVYPTKSCFRLDGFYGPVYKIKSKKIK